jgi:hypothetical protein
MNSTYIVRGGLQNCPTHPARWMICWVFGLEVEVALQIGVILQVGAPAPKQKRSPLNNKGQTPYSSPIFQGANEIHLAFVSSLFYHHVCKSWVGHPACKPTELNLL